MGTGTLETDKHGKVWYVPSREERIQEWKKTGCMFGGGLIFAFAGIGILATFGVNPEAHPLLSSFLPSFSMIIGMAAGYSFNARRNGH